MLLFCQPCAGLQQQGGVVPTPCFTSTSCFGYQTQTPKALGTVCLGNHCHYSSSVSRSIALHTSNNGRVMCIGVGVDNHLQTPGFVDYYWHEARGYNCHARASMALITSMACDGAAALPKGPMVGCLEGVNIIVAMLTAAATSSAQCLVASSGAYIPQSSRGVAFGHGSCGCAALWTAASCTCSPCLVAPTWPIVLCAVLHYIWCLLRAVTEGVVGRSGATLVHASCRLPLLAMS